MVTYHYVDTVGSFCERFIRIIGWKSGKDWPSNSQDLRLYCVQWTKGTQSQTSLALSKLGMSCSQLSKSASVLRGAALHIWLHRRADWVPECIIQPRERFGCLKMLKMSSDKIRFWLFNDLFYPHQNVFKNTFYNLNLSFWSLPSSQHQSTTLISHASMLEFH